MMDATAALLFFGTEFVDDRARERRGSRDILTDFQPHATPRTWLGIDLGMQG